jgi:WD40 repeat protein
MDSFDLSSFLPKRKPGGVHTSNDLKLLPVASRKKVEIIRELKKEERQSVTLASANNNLTEAENEDDRPDSESGAREFLPMTNVVNLAKHHQRTVSALSMDPKGVRMISGGYDYNIHFWDFNGMDQSFRSFREIQPWEGYQIKELRFSHTGDSFLVASGAVVPKLFDREGHLL